MQTRDHRPRWIEQVQGTDSAPPASAQLTCSSQIAPNPWYAPLIQHRCIHVSLIRANNIAMPRWESPLSRGCWRSVRVQSVPASSAVRAPPPHSRCSPTAAASARIAATGAQLSCDPITQTTTAVCIAAHGRSLTLSTRHHPMPRHITQPHHTRALRNMRSHGESSPQPAGCQLRLTERGVRSGCGIKMVARPSVLVRPVMPSGDPFGLSGY